MQTHTKKAGGTMKQNNGSGLALGAALQACVRGASTLALLAITTALAAAPAAAAEIQFIKSLGGATSTANGTGQSVTIPAGGVDAGATILVSASFTNSAASPNLAGAVSATDTAGNVYVVVADAHNTNQVRNVLLAAVNANALNQGNTITVTTPSHNRRTITAAEFWGVKALDDTSTGTGNSTSMSSGTATASTADQLLVGSFGIRGNGNDGFTAGGDFDLILRNFTAAGTAPPGVVTNAIQYQIIDTADDYESTATIGTTRQWAAGLATFTENTTCGDGNVDPGEDCDLAGLNGDPSSCCTANCRFRPSGQLCRASTGACDPQEVCTGADDTCPTDDLHPNGFVCRASGGPCDIEETCDGVDTQCPADEIEADGTPCPDDGTSCTIDVCNGVSKACQHIDDSSTPCIKFIQTVGTFTSTTAAQTQSAVTVPASGVAAGGSIILTMGMPSSALVGAISATDSAGNVYAVDADVTNPSQVRIAVLSSHKVNPLGPGDTITVTHPSTNRRNLVVAEFSGIAANPVDQTATSTGTMNNVNPPTSGTTATTTQADQLLIGAFGVAGSLADNFNLSTSPFNLIARVSASNTAPAVQNAAIYRVVNEIDEYNAFFTTSTGTTRQYAGAIVTYKADLSCGDAVVDPGEDCDQGIGVNDTGTSCCTRNCVFAGTASVCRAADDLCDAPETCTGSSEACPADEVHPDSVVCRTSAGVCDVAETCDGINKACPPNLFEPDTVLCRAAAASCDAEEYCTGSAAACPANALHPLGFVCREATGPCDVDETCTGVSISCGPDLVRPNGFVCNTDVDDLCDVVDTCDGFSKDCDDAIAPLGTECRTATDLCDVADHCDGVSKVCADDVATEGTVCGDPPSDVCDAVDTCDGSSKVCVDGVLPATEVCRESVDLCDAPENCTGVAKACPTDLVRPSSFTCRPAAGLCDIPENCTGSSNECPADVLQPNTFPCRPATGECDIPDLCTGTEVTCPEEDKHVEAGTICEGSNPNSCLNACLDGQCVDGLEVTNQPCCGNGLVDDGETCDDRNQISGGGDTCPSGPGDGCNFFDGTSRVLVRGSKKAPTADRRTCQLEYAVTNPTNPLDRFGRPQIRQVCHDQDPTCDFDPTPGRCRFAVSVCLNNNDPVLVQCVPNGVSSVDFGRPRGRPGSALLTLEAANHAKLNGAVQALLNPADPDAWYTYGLPVQVGDQNLCSKTVLLDVDAGLGGRDSLSKSFRLRARTRDGSGLPTRSLLHLICVTQ